MLDVPASFLGVLIATSICAFCETQLCNVCVALESAP